MLAVRVAGDVDGAGEVTEKVAKPATCSVARPSRQSCFSLLPAQGSRSGCPNEPRKE